MRKTRNSESLRVLIVLSVLSAIGIILGKFLAFNITEFMRFSLENISILFAAIVFGPVAGMAVGAVQDLVGCLAVGYTINPLITLGCVVNGFVAGCLFKFFKKLPISVRLSFSISISHLFGSVLIKTVGLSIFYSLPFVPTMLWRLLNYTIVGVAEVILLGIILKSKQLLTQINKIKSFSTSSFYSYKEAECFAKTTSNVFSKPGLERIDKLLSYLSHPEKDIKTVHIAGTNGKGSTAAILASILKSSGLKVGSFTSPYLLEMRESIRINCEPIEEKILISLFEKLKPFVDEMADKPTEFELLTAAAFIAFKDAEVDIAVIECGMGGRMDATNVIESPLLSIITNVSIDHTSFLGETIAQIASEKAGIIKKGCPVLIGQVNDEAENPIGHRAKDLSSDLYRTESVKLISSTVERTVFSYKNLDDVCLHLIGIHQPYNAAVSIEAAYILSGHFPSITDSTIKQGVALAKWMGRFEILCREPLFIFDGAHNKDGISCAAKTVRELPLKKAICISGVLRDKDYEAIADEIASISHYIFTVAPNNKRALSSSEFCSVLLSRGAKAVTANSVGEAVRSAICIAQKDDSPIICLGSLYLYAEVKRAVDEYKNSAYQI